MTSSAAGTAPWPRPVYAWYVVTLLLLAYASAIVDRIIIGLLVEPIKADLGLSDTQIGLIQGLAFALFYSLFTLPIGLLIDRWRRSPILWLGIAVWSVATVAAGLAKSFAALFATRVVVGAGEATTTPASSSLISDYFPPEVRPRAFGIFVMGSSVGVGIAYLFGSVALRTAGSLRDSFPQWLGGFADWQIVFFIVGAPGLLLAALMALTIREPLRRGTTADTERLSLRPLLQEVSANRTALVTVMVGAIANVMIVNAKLSWFPTLFIRVHGWDSADVATALFAVGVPIGLISAVTAGWAMSAMAKRGRTDGPILVILAQCVSWVIFGTYQCLSPSPYGALAAHAITALFATWAVAAALTALNQITPNRLRGQVVAIYTLLLGLIGVGAGAVVVGALSDYVFIGPAGIAPSLAWVCAVVGTLGCGILIWGRRHYQAAVERARHWDESE